MKKIQTILSLGWDSDLFLAAEDFAAATALFSRDVAEEPESESDPEPPPDSDAEVSFSSLTGPTF